jgi:hypothetical protein
VAPIEAGWLVAYCGPDGHLLGGSDDRKSGTVVSCEYVTVNRSFMVTLTDGATLRLGQIRSGAQTNAAGQVIAAWTVEAHGYDGKKRS